MMKLKYLTSHQNIDFFNSENDSELSLPFAESISAGFPSPAEEYLELSLDLNKALIQHPSSTFFGRVKGNSMHDAGIHEGDILVIDKSLSPVNGRKAVCYIDGEFTLKTLKVDQTGIWLMPANPDYKPVKVTEENNFIVWGIVTFVIHKL
jgi:DNA polymerase V